jgi:hypothetical protein
VGPPSALDHLRRWQPRLAAAGLDASLRWAEPASWSIHADLHASLLRRAEAVIVWVADHAGAIATGFAAAHALPVIAVVPSYLHTPPFHTPLDTRVTVLPVHPDDTVLADAVAEATWTAIRRVRKERGDELAALRRRVVFLDERIRGASFPLTYDEAELAALDRVLAYFDVKWMNETEALPGD